jgi:hypothetical protein
VILYLCLVVGASAYTTIPFRQFSTSPGLGRVLQMFPDVPDQSDDYGALQIFVKNMMFFTSYPTDIDRVDFVIDNWSANPGCSIYDTVSALKPKCALPANRTDHAQAAFVNGDIMDSPWGFMFNSVPFNMIFESHMEWLFDFGAINNMSPLEYIHNMALAGDNIVALPVLGGSSQMSNMFKKSMTTDGITALCKEGRTFLDSHQHLDILDIACSNMERDEVSHIKNISCIPDVSVLCGVQNGHITSFEFAAIDNWNSSVGEFFPDLSNRDFLNCTKYTPESGKCAQNPGHKGLTFMHYPAWHQPFISGYFIMNVDVWKRLSTVQRIALRKASRYSMYETYLASSTLECELVKNQLKFNDNEVQLNIDGTVKDCNSTQPGVQSCSADIVLKPWNSASLDTLTVSLNDYITKINSTITPQNREILTTLIDSYRAYNKYSNANTRPNQFIC